MILTSSPDCALVSEALTLAQAEVRAAHKSGHNTFDKYSYAKLEDFLTAIREPLAKYGLGIVFSNSEVETLPDRPTKNAGLDHAARAKVDARLVHKSGQWIQVSCYGEGQDRADKSIYKALTGAKKYVVAGLLAIPTTDDAEADDDDRRAPAPPPAPAAKRPAAAPAAPAPAPAPAPVDPDRKRAVDLYTRLRSVDAKRADAIRAEHAGNYKLMADTLDRVLVELGELPPA